MRRKGLQRSEANPELWFKTWPGHSHRTNPVMIAILNSEQSNKNKKKKNTLESEQKQADSEEKVNNTE